MFKVKNRNTRTTCEIRSMLTIKAPERHQWRCSSVFIVNFEHTSHLVLVLLLLTLSMQMPAWTFFFTHGIEGAILVTMEMPKIWYMRMSMKWSCYCYLCIGMWHQLSSSTGKTVFLMLIVILMQNEWKEFRIFT